MKAAAEEADQTKMRMKKVDLGRTALVTLRCSVALRAQNGYAARSKGVETLKESESSSMDFKFSRGQVIIQEQQ